MFNKIIFNISRIFRNHGVSFSNEVNCSHLVLMRNKIKESNGIEFKIEFYPDGNWTAESTNIDGIITGGDDIKEINNLIKDAIFTYFEIPPQFCNDSILKANNFIASFIGV